MTLTDDMTQQTYLEAQAELNAVLRSRVASIEQKRAALDAMEELDRKFIRKTTASLEARTKQFKAFIRQMNEVIASIEGAGSPFKSLKRLKEIVDNANDILNDDSE
jgi:recombinational DNA repair ATPase RecF